MANPKLQLLSTMGSSIWASVLYNSLIFQRLPQVPVFPWSLLEKSLEPGEKKEKPQSWSESDRPDLSTPALTFVGHLALDDSFSLSKLYFSYSTMGVIILQHGTFQRIKRRLRSMLVMSDT